MPVLPAQPGEGVRGDARRPAGSHARRRAGRRAPPGPGDVRGGVRPPPPRGGVGDPAGLPSAGPGEVAGASAVGGGGGPSTPPWGAGAGAAVRARRGGGGVVPRQPRPAGHLGWVLGAGLRPPLHQVRPLGVPRGRARRGAGARCARRGRCPGSVDGRQDGEGRRKGQTGCGRASCARSSPYGVLRCPGPSSPSRARGGISPTQLQQRLVLALSLVQETAPAH